MSDHPPHGASKIHASKHGDHGGGGGKWLLGGLAAVVLLGGGYYVYQSMAPAPANTEIAYNDELYGDDPLRAGPFDEGDEPSAESAIADEEPVAAPTASETRRSTARARTATSSAASAEPVPEATIGVTPVSLTTTEDDGDIVVTAPRRPVWVRTPSERRLSNMYPARALQQGLEGEASLECMVEQGGALDCMPVSETESGFGNAALRVSRSLRHASQTADGRDAVGTPVNLRVVFRMEDGARRG